MKDYVCFFSPEKLGDRIQGLREGVLLLGAGEKNPGPSCSMPSMPIMMEINSPFIAPL